MQNLKGDLVGGVISALVALPLALACGILLFKGIDGLQQYGINAAFYTAIVGAIISAFVGNHSLQIGGPLVVTTLILSDFLIKVYEEIKFDNIDVNMTLIVLMFTCVIITGLIQFIFAYLKAGKLIKFLPLSVTMGISTTIGMIIIVKQLPIIFNSNSTNTSETLLLIFITLFILILMFSRDFIPNKEELIKKLKFNPFLLFPIVVPILATIIFFLFNNNENLLLGNVNVEVPTLIQNYEGFLSSYNYIFQFLPELLLTSFAIALMSSLSSLLSVSLLERKIKNRSHDTSIELKGQALGNILSGFLGGMPSAGTEARSLVNYYAGARTKVSVLINALTIFLVIFIFNNYLPLIPEIILSVILVYTGLIMSLPSIKLAKNLCGICLNKNHTKNCIKDIVYTFSIIFIMLTTAFLSDITIAIVFGFAVASLFFIYEMMRNSNYTIIDARALHSKRERTFQAKECIQNNGELINIIELDGAIFFGTADSLRNTISSIKGKVKWVILDFKKINEIDITGSEIIKLCIEENKNLNFSLSHIREGDDTYQAFCSVGLIGKDGLKWFEYTDFALENVENLLLKSFNISIYLDKKVYDLEELNVTKNLNSTEQKILMRYLDIKSFKQGEYLYKEGELSNEVFFLREGSVTIWDEHDDELYNKSIISKTRRVTYSAGVVIGQMAFFDSEIHTVEALADLDISTYSLSKSNFEKLRREHPLVAEELMLQFCKHLSRRLKEITYEVQVLERWN
ncbi:hypothetical protein LPB137_13490 [Poseidonibacter parvus]|uniref:Sulfate permease n=1 Tax=Poseidonibacter parvus TaxID=1850254 RepID=A0A1P8KQK2_9BACT|nr:SulP family inorganic anion transporter [Poseidonibacter parvus]APW66801.1 hypothetical protein LPB137_13490 [Poseidonibacter parvus]